MANTTVINEIVRRYAKGNGESVEAIAKACQLTVAAVRYNLKARGEYAEPKANVEEASVSDLIDDDEPAADDLSALLANPALAKLIDGAIAARMAQLSAVAPQSAGGDQMQVFAEAMKRLIDTQAQQMPGYIKPLPSEEIERRLAGKVEMFALLQDFERRNLPPLWVVGEKGFVECTNMQEFKQGESIRTYLPPVEDFVPMNEEAEAVHVAMMRWLGAPTPDIGEQLKQAQMNSKMAPLVSSASDAVTKPTLVERVSASDTPVRKATAKRRTMGSIIPEARDIVIGDRMGMASGPSFVNAA